MNKKDIAGMIYDYVVQGLKQEIIANTYGTDQWSGVSGTIKSYGFYSESLGRGGYKKRYARGYKGLEVTFDMIYDYVRKVGPESDYHFEDFVDDNFDYYAKKQKVGKYAKTTTTKTTTTKTNTGRTTNSTAGRSGYGNGGYSGGYQPTYTYTPPQQEEPFYYYCAVFKSADAFWVVQFATLENKAEAYAPQFAQWVDTVTFG